MVDRAKICPPRSRIGAITPAERKAVIAASPLAGKYDGEVDRISAYERLKERAAAPAPVSAPPPARGSVPETPLLETRLPVRPAPAPAGVVKAPPSSGDLLTNIFLGDGRRQGLVESVAKSMLRGAGSQVGTRVGRSLVRGVLGSLLK
jgi:uncharacterized protein